MIKKKNNQGFTLLFAALIGALVLAVGIAILSIALKQMTLSSAGRATQQSFYSADSAIECALYLDRGAGISECRLGFFPSPDVASPQGYSSCTDSGVSKDQIRCFGKKIVINGDGAPDTSIAGLVTSTFSIVSNSLGAGNSADWDAETTNNADVCFSVAVTKNGFDSSTIIESRGYNTCNVDAVNRFERAIRSKNQ